MEWNGRIWLGGMNFSLHRSRGCWFVTAGIPPHRWFMPKDRSVSRCHRKGRTPQFAFAVIPVVPTSLEAKRMPTWTESATMMNCLSMERIRAIPIRTVMVCRMVTKLVGAMQSMETVFLERARRGWSSGRSRISRDVSGPPIWNAGMKRNGIMIYGLTMERTVPTMRRENVSCPLIGTFPWSSGFRGCWFPM